MGSLSASGSESVQPRIRERGPEFPSHHFTRSSNRLLCRRAHQGTGSLARSPIKPNRVISACLSTEADLVIKIARIVEVKRSSAPVPSRGFYQAAADVGAARKLLVAPVPVPYPARDGIEVMGPLAAVAALGTFTQSMSAPFA